MRLLLDTCTALWYWAGSRQLSTVAESMIRDPANDVVFHQVSFLEIALKYSLGKLRLSDPPSVLVPRALAAYELVFAQLSNRDIARIESLPFHHRDPFDRLLVAHALETRMTVVTPDPKFPPYGVPVAW